MLADKIDPGSQTEIDLEETRPNRIKSMGASQPLFQISGVNRAARFFQLT